MTVAIVCPFEDGVLFCADTKLSTGYEKRNQSKILWRRWGTEVDNVVTVFAVAGSVPYATAAVERCEAALDDLDFNNTSLEAMQSRIDSALNAYYQSHIFPHPDRLTGAVAFDLLIGLWLHGNMRIFATQQTALTDVYGYECVGSGGYLARYCLREALGDENEFDRAQLTVGEASLILEHAINSAVEYDESCGYDKHGTYMGEAEYVGMMLDGSVGDIREHTFLADFPEVLRSESWSLLRRLARQSNPDEQEISVEEFCNTIRQHYDRVGSIFRHVDDLNRGLINNNDADGDNDPD